LLGNYCRGLQAGTGGGWLQDMNNPGSAAISGNATFLGGTSNWSFRRD
jgi:hypothetical protein